jgi:hypothetical protein
MYKQLWLMVEGVDDERFCEKIVAPLLKKQYDIIKCWRYAEKTDKNIKSFLQTINSMQTWDYIFLGDINHSPCVTDKKAKLLKSFNPHLSQGKIRIVIKEIESWYLAGLESKSLKQLGLKAIADTNDVTKEDFSRLIPSKYDRTDFMLEVLEKYDVKIAKKKNASFAYFVQKFGLSD